MIPRIQVLKAVKFIEAESRIVGVRGYREGRMGSFCCLMSIEFQFCKMKKF